MADPRPRTVTNHPPGTEVRVESLPSGAVRLTVIEPAPKMPLDERRKRFA